MKNNLKSYKNGVIYRNKNRKIAFYDEDGYTYIIMAFVLSKDHPDATGKSLRERYTVTPLKITKDGFDTLTVAFIEFIKNHR